LASDKDQDLIARMTAPRLSLAWRARTLFAALAFVLMPFPTLAQWSLDAAPPPDSPEGGVLGGQYCRDLASMIWILEQRADAYQQAAETFGGRTDTAARQAVQRAGVERDKARHEAIPLRQLYALRCDRLLLPAVAPPHGALPEDGVPEDLVGAPLGIDLPSELAGTDGWVVRVGGMMNRPWRTDLPGQQVRSELWMYLSDERGLIYVEPVVDEVAEGARFTLRMTCERVAMAGETAFRFEASVRNFPERRYVAEGAVEVTGPMMMDNGGAGWPVRVRYAFSYQQRGDGGVRFADGGLFEGEGIARRLSDVERRMQLSTQAQEHTCGR
jgi:hypothetical protein